MISLMLVAGDRTDKLAKFMEDKGTFAVPFIYDSLSQSLAQIKDDIIDVDKLLYLYQGESLNIRADMQALKSLLELNGFFKVKEIVFAVTDNDDKDRVISYFNAVMKDSPHIKYSIKVLGAKPSFSEIYDNVLGVSRSLNFRNSYKNIYRTERNDTSTTAYEATDSKNVKIEPFDYSNLGRYENAKENAVKIDSGITHQDREVEFLQFSEPDFGSMQINSVLSECRTEIFCGLPKTGVSTWALALAHSVKESGQKITLIDLSDNCDLGYLLKVNGISYNEVSMLDMLKLYEPSSDIINLCSVKNEAERSVKIEFLKEFYSKAVIPNGYVFIMLPLRDLFEVFELLHNDLHNIFVGTAPLYCDVMYLQQFLQLYEDQVDIRVFLSRRLPLLKEEYLSAEQVKDLLPFDNISIVDYVDFPTLEMDRNLSAQLLEV